MVGQINLDEMIMKYSRTFLHNVVIKNDIDELQNLLESTIAFNISVNSVTDGDGSTPLHLGVNRGYLLICKKLLQNGANIDISDIYGNTALTIATTNGDLNMIELLLEFKPDINNKNNQKSLRIALRNYRRKYFYENTRDYVYVRIIKDLLTYGFKADVIESNAILHYGCLDMFQILLEFDAVPINSRDHYGRTPIFYACERNAVNIAFTLLIMNAEMNICDNDNCTPLHIAIQEGSNETSEMLIQNGADINILDKSGKSVLYKAIETDNLEMIKLILEHHPNMKDNEGNRHAFLMGIETYEGHPLILDVLFKSEYTIKPENKNDIHLLQIANRLYHLEIVKKLLEYGADVNSKYSEDGSTLLKVAILHRHKGLIQLLMRFKPDLNILDDFGNTVLHAAIENESDDDTLTSLVWHGANLHHINSDGDNLLHVAVKKGNLRIIKFLLNTKQFNLNEMNMKRQNVLYEAIMNRRIDIVKLLLDHGANVNVILEDNKIPLHIAITALLMEMVKLLIYYGADINYVCTMNSIDNVTILHYAVMYGNKEIIEFFLKHCSHQLNCKDSIGKTPVDYIS